MSDNYLEMLLKELQKNGVSLRKIPFNTDKFTVDELEIEAIKTESFNFLDFSEHDKAFENEIAGLKAKIAIKDMDYKTVSELLGKYQQENESLKQRIDELESKNNQLTESILRKETKIHELESKETQSFDEVPDDITIDGYKCKIIKTESGLYISRDEIYSIIDKEKEPLKQKCKELEDRHQSNCIEVNRLNTAIDVLIHKVEYLRQFAGLE